MALFDILIHATFVGAAFGGPLLIFGIPHNGSQRAGSPTNHYEAVGNVGAHSVRTQPAEKEYFQKPLDNPEKRCYNYINE